jgi:hypothetical protein
MMLDGKSYEKSNQEDKGELHLTKTDRPVNRDEWDELIKNFTVGGNDPDIIASTESYWKNNQPSSVVTVTEIKTDNPPLEPKVKVEEPVLQPTPAKNDESPSVSASPIPTTVLVEKKKPEIQKSFEERRKVLTIDIPLKGDSIEISFYDNAEIDGDSISLFLNSRMQFEHVRLSEKAYTLKFAIKDLNEVNELVMVAENLGAIPPNTSYMIAYVNGERITANLESTENSSAMIRLVKPK